MKAVWIVERSGDTETRNTSALAGDCATPVIAKAKGTWINRLEERHTYTEVTVSLVNLEPRGDN